MKTASVTPNRFSRIKRVTSPSGAITQYANGGVGFTIVTSAGHNRTNGDSVIINGSTNYNGNFVISAVTPNTFNIPRAFVGDDAVGNWVSFIPKNPSPGLMWLDEYNDRMNVEGASYSNPVQMQNDWESWLRGHSFQTRIEGFVDFTTSEPAQTSGVRYINTVGGPSSITGQMVSQNVIYEWDANNGFWNDIGFANEGTVVYDFNTSTHYIYDGANWIVWPTVIPPKRYATFLVSTDLNDNPDYTAIKDAVDALTTLGYGGTVYVMNRDDRYEESEMTITTDIELVGIGFPTVRPIGDNDVFVCGMEVDVKIHGFKLDDIVGASNKAIVRIDGNSNSGSLEVCDNIVRLFGANDLVRAILYDDVQSIKILRNKIRTLLVDQRLFRSGVTFYRITDLRISDNSVHCISVYAPFQQYLISIDGYMSNVFIENNNVYDDCIGFLDLSRTVGGFQLNENVNITNNLVKFQAGAWIRTKFTNNDFRPIVIENNIFHRLGGVLGSVATLFYGGYFSQGCINGNVFSFDDYWNDGTIYGGSYSGGGHGQDWDVVTEGNVISGLGTLQSFGMFVGNHIYLNGVNLSIIEASSWQSQFQNNQILGDGSESVTFVATTWSLISNNYFSQPVIISLAGSSNRVTDNVFGASCTISFDECDIMGNYFSSSTILQFASTNPNNGGNVWNNFFRTGNLTVNKRDNFMFDNNRIFSAGIISITALGNSSMRNNDIVGNTETINLGNNAIIDGNRMTKGPGALTVTVGTNSIVTSNHMTGVILTTGAGSVAANNL